MFHILIIYTVDVPNAGEKLKRYQLAVSSMAVSHTLFWCRLDYRTQEWDTDFRAYLKQLDSKKPLILCSDLNMAYQEIGTNRTALTLNHS